MPLVDRVARVQNVRRATRAHVMHRHRHGRRTSVVVRWVVRSVAGVVLRWS